MARISSNAPKLLLLAAVLAFIAGTALDSAATIAATSNMILVNNTLNFSSGTATDAANVVVSVPAYSNTVINYAPAGATLTILSSDSVPLSASILITNQYDNATYGSSTPTQGSTIFSKLVILNVSLNLVLKYVSYSLSVGHACGTNVAPFSYDRATGTWAPLAVTNTVTVSPCSITFTIPADPIIGVFAETLPQTSPSGSSGSGSSGGSGGSGGAASGGGGTAPTGPGLTRFSQNGTACYQIANITTPNYVNFTLNGTPFVVTVSSIAPNSTDLIINGETYVLRPNAPASIGSYEGFNYTADLMGISYLPILHTITADICSIAIASAKKPVNVTKPNNALAANTIATSSAPNSPTNKPNPASNTPATAPAAAPSTSTSGNIYKLVAIIAATAIVIVLLLAHYGNWRRKRALLASNDKM